MVGHDAAQLNGSFFWARSLCQVWSYPVGTLINFDHQRAIIGVIIGALLCNPLGRRNTVWLGRLFIPVPV